MGGRKPSRRVCAAAFGACLALPAAAAAAETLRARVLLDDVIPPSTPIAVRLDCGGNTRAETTADAEGRFALPLPEKSARAACRLAASAAGYEPASEALDRLPENPDIGGLVLQRAGRWSGYALSATSLSVDPHARRLFAEAVESLRAGGRQGLERAERGFARAAEADPSFAEAWYQLGRLRLARQDAEGGGEALRRALEADPWYVSPYRPLLLLELGLGRWAEVRDRSAQLLRLNPYLADIRYYHGLASLELGNTAGAEAEVEAIRSGPEGASFGPVHHLRGVLLERGGRTEEARQAYEQYLAAEPDGMAAEEVRARLEALKAP
ncbi:MAG: hypothetical protein GC160_10775 [Acidobacteria bacterium]|nr:hypothetical protein [Acidobacteriota bacterium]